jgi:hypothetical protein
MEYFLTELHERHGGAMQWALAAGITPQSLERMSTLLLADPE